MPYSRLIRLLVVVLLLGGCARVPIILPPKQTVSSLKTQEGSYHKVLKGQTLWRISKIYGVDMEKIAAANDLKDIEYIEVGQDIFIPSAEKPLKEKQAIELAYSKEDFIWPLKGRIIVSFGEKKAASPSKGVDIQAKEGALVAASRSGKVIFCEDKLKGYGKTVIIDHGDGLQTVYAHNSKILVGVGEDVKQSVPIAKVGSTGRNKAPYLHFEIRKGHSPQNPFRYLPR
ncbi:MAG: LysM peptidoglycan-binding domain-containing M23 family metallopeptidase [Candidatus Omnitrophota bacterium]